MASENIVRSMSCEQDDEVLKQEEDTNLTVDSLNVANGSLKIKISRKVLEKRKFSSYRNLGLPVVLTTAAEDNVRNVDKSDDVYLDNTKFDDANLQHKKRKRVHHDYRKLSNSGYVDDAMGRRYSSSTSSESDLPKCLHFKICTPPSGLIHGEDNSKPEILNGEIFEVIKNKVATQIQTFFIPWQQLLRSLVKKLKLLYPRNYLRY
ncbi:unnamed protein product [Timema podura]|uniref:Uncharacterized protein n=1 Tax=Timema podura TaxID=61482 RepID=A0ABN7NIR2_TIMPD|nr:unnamed protein product [Timema podura]